MVRHLISLPFLVMAAWTAVLAWLLYDLNYQLFLSPKFGFLVYISMALCLLFALSLTTLGRNANTHKPGDQLIKGLILLLPVLFIFSAGENTLGNFALSKRAITPLRTNTSQEAPPLPEATTPGAETGEFPLVSISQLVRNWDGYNGKSISVEGLFSETIMDHEELSAVFRYFINCCVADAMPVGVFMSRKEDAGLKNDDWVRISGSVRMDQLDGYDIIFMEVAAVEKRKKPSKNAAYIFE